MRTLHLTVADGPLWCEPEGDCAESTDDPREATCVDCLRRAASYGAAAAMRYAAVRNSSPRDAEVAKERDEAMRRLNAITDALEGQRCFFCNDCLKLKGTDERALTAGKLSWCDRCAAKRVPT